MTGAALDLSPMFPESLVMTGTDQNMRRTRTVQGKHRAWTIVPRYGTANSDRWTFYGSPIPGPNNPAADIEDGQFPSLAAVREALALSEADDNGEHAL